MAAAALVYDAWYMHVTGQRFWAQYWQDQMSPVTLATPIDQAGTFAGHIFFYVVRLLWHPAPWSLVMVFMAWRGRARLLTFLGDGSSLARAALFVIGFALLSVLVLGPSSRVAERYVFSATYGIGAAGAVVTWRSWADIPARLRKGRRPHSSAASGRLDDARAPQACGRSMVAANSVAAIARASVPIARAPFADEVIVPFPDRADDDRAIDVERPLALVPHRDRDVRNRARDEQDHGDGAHRPRLEQRRPHVERVNHDHRKHDVERV